MVVVFFVIVSRCGMVYLEFSYIGLGSFVECWIRKFFDVIYFYKEKLEGLFEKFMEVGFFILYIVCLDRYVII